MPLFQWSRVRCIHCNFAASLALDRTLNSASCCRMLSAFFFFWKILPHLALFKKNLWALNAVVGVWSLFPLPNIWFAYPVSINRPTASYVEIAQYKVVKVVENLFASIIYHPYGLIHSLLITKAIISLVTSFRINSIEYSAVCWETIAIFIRARLYDSAFHFLCCSFNIVAEFVQLHDNAKFGGHLFASIITLRCNILPLFKTYLSISL